jgi:uncharacterized integral membrane protein
MKKEDIFDWFVIWAIIFLLLLLFITVNYVL